MLQNQQELDKNHLQYLKALRKRASGLQPLPFPLFYSASTSTAPLFELLSANHK